MGIIPYGISSYVSFFIVNSSNQFYALSHSDGHSLLSHDFLIVLLMLRHFSRLFIIYVHSNLPYLMG